MSLQGRRAPCRRRDCRSKKATGFFDDVATSGTSQWRGRTRLVKNAAIGGGDDHSIASTQSSDERGASANGCPTPFARHVGAGDDCRSDTSAHPVNHMPTNGDGRSNAPTQLVDNVAMERGSGHSNARTCAAAFSTVITIVTAALISRWVPSRVDEHESCPTSASNGPQLYPYFNDVGVRSFILTGAPLGYKTGHARAGGPRLNSGQRAQEYAFNCMMRDSFASSSTRWVSMRR